MMRLPYGEEIMIVGRTVWTQSTSVTDRQTDGRTDRITITKTEQRIASHGKNGIGKRFSEQTTYAATYGSENNCETADKVIVK